MENALYYKGEVGSSLGLLHLFNQIGSSHLIDEPANCCYTHNTMRHTFVKTMNGYLPGALLDLYPEEEDSVSGWGAEAIEIQCNALQCRQRGP